MTYDRVPGTDGPSYVYGNSWSALVFPQPNGMARWYVLDPDGAERYSGTAQDENLAWQECNTRVEEHL